MPDNVVPSEAVAQAFVDRARALVEENAALRARAAALEARCAAQEAVLARAHELMTALDDYAQEQGKPQAPAARKPRGQKSRHSRRYTDDDVRHWRDAVRAGVPLGELARRLEVRPETITRRLKKLAAEEAEAPEGPPPAPPAAREAAHGYSPEFLARFTDVQALEAGRQIRGGWSPQEAAEVFGVGVETLRRALRRLDMDPDTGAFLHRPPLEELLQEPARASGGSAE